MNERDDANHVEELLRRCGPDGPDARLRSQVLGAMACELSCNAQCDVPRRRSLASPGFVVAASLALGAVLNLWVMAAERDRDARMFGQRPTPRAIVEVVAAVRSVTDRETALLVEKTLRCACEKQPPRPLWPPDLGRIMNQPLFRGSACDETN